MLTRLDIAQENGLFEHQSAKLYDDIHAPLMKALGLSVKKNCSAIEYVEARNEIDMARKDLNTAIHKVRFRDKFNYVYGFPILIYLLGLLALIAFRENLKNLVGPLGATHILLPSIPTQIILSGAIGGILRGIIALWRQVDKMQYRKIWVTWFILCPVTGALLGGVVYLGFFVGILVTTSGTISNPALPILIAAIAGLNWEWALSVLQNVATVFKVETKKV